MWWIVALSLLAGEPEPARKPVLVVFDFESQGDQGQVDERGDVAPRGVLGRWVARNLRQKAQRTGRYAVVEDIERREVETEHQFVPSVGQKHDVNVTFARKFFEADLVVWGKVDRRGDPLDIVVRAARCDDASFKMLVSRIFTAPNRHMTGPMVEQVLRVLAGEPQPVVLPDAAAEEAWRTGPDLLPNPGFEQGTGHPDGWEPLGVDWQHGCVSWVTAPGPDGRGKCMKFDVPADIAGSYGAAYYSLPIDIAQGTLYRFSVRVRSDSPTVKIFLKQYAWFEPVGDEQAGQWRETRRAPLNCHGAGRQWKTFTRDFHPRRNDAYDPQRLRVDLYAYWPAGVVYFDDVVLKRLK